MKTNLKLIQEVQQTAFDEFVDHLLMDGRAGIHPLNFHDMLFRFRDIELPKKKKSIPKRDISSIFHAFILASSVLLSDFDPWNIPASMIQDKIKKLFPELDQHFEEDYIPTICQIVRDTFTTDLLIRIINKD